MPYFRADGGRRPRGRSSFDERPGCYLVGRPELLGHGREGAVRAGRLRGPLYQCGIRIRGLSAGPPTAEMVVCALESGALFGRTDVRRLCFRRIRLPGTAPGQTEGEKSGGGRSFRPMSLGVSQRRGSLLLPGNVRGSGHGCDLRCVFGGRIR